MSNTLDFKPADRGERAGADPQAGPQRRARFFENLTAEQSQRLYKASQLILLLTSALESLIGLRVLLKLVAANPANPFASFVYKITALFLEPFAGLTANPAAAGMVLEVHALIAMLVYALITWGIVRLLWLIFDQP